ncbi:MAG: Holliday junction branch migration protein RuvA [Lachnospiraceae bacterium]|nr:Holliday junction branch migration protein RuvA [Lachnospiraceae bacterium]
MIAFVKGEIAAIYEDNVVIDTGSIGYEVKISTGTVNLLPGIGQTVRLYTYTHVREDLFQLYGFLTRDDMEIFKQLISVSGIGPKGGLAVLSVMSADDLRFAIISGDAKAISKAPGIGTRTAERVILDLRGKVSPEDTFRADEMRSYGSIGSAALPNGAKNEAVEALVALGYGATEALKAVKKVDTDTEDMDTETILKAALKNLF